METLLGTRYIIKISGITSSFGFYDHYKECPYVKSFYNSPEMTKDPFMARFFKREETAIKCAENIEKSLNGPGCFRPYRKDNPNMKVEVIKVDLNISLE